MHITRLPKTALLDSEGKPLSQKVHHVTGHPVKTVLVKPGKLAYFSFSYLDGAFCVGHAFNAFGAVFFPPGATAGFKHKHSRFSACTNSPGVFPLRTSPAVV